ncbi:MAG: hypothetical protein DIZ77_05875 [endosymbiont of Seepiophila jonesi]|uniref:Uncharacterized protein n=1 Tax=endosymbiont of Lamellibrachia luymesi TaxID=2200907 RepID=A0A370DVM0_9GAMM|nr:MAG: hypothetical protein DIZ79_11795 [endosymbiont of Lamellibrachia luymesi]RDH93383.1 MAG: hypothetical protein DIZ77_05875 [endosymbiont of Seepiophila jonesi]
MRAYSFIYGCQGLLAQNSNIRLRIGNRANGNNYQVIGYLQEPLLFRGPLVHLWLDSIIIMGWWSLQFLDDPQLSWVRRQVQA